MKNICDTTLEEMRGIHKEASLEILTIMSIPLPRPLKRENYPEIKNLKLVKAIVDGEEEARYFLQKPLKETYYRSMREDRGKKLSKQATVLYSYNGGN
ncbi:hypothetical protein JXC34_01390 [Candidatus Woesearchaeota archaeon]|nr:hypothetical protein [Candidatus Woesearchaeota archaeon]